MPDSISDPTAAASQREAARRSHTGGSLHGDIITRSIRATPVYWFSMFAGSALGTNLGDYVVDDLSLGRDISFALLAAIAGVAIWADRKFAGQTDLGYWLAIVALRAAATNVGDFLTHDLAIGFTFLTVILGIATLVAGRFTRAGSTGSGSPRIDGRYWSAMLLAGIFGTVGGDLASHLLGLYAAAAVLCAASLAVLWARTRFAPASMLAYWCIVLAERCAGTPVGDGLASHRALGLGLPLAMACTGGLLAVGLLVRYRGAWSTRTALQVPEVERAAVPR